MSHPREHKASYKEAREELIGAIEKLSVVKPAAPAPAPAPAPVKESVLDKVKTVATKKYGPLPAWGWASIVGGLGGLWWWKKR